MRGVVFENKKWKYLPPVIISALILFSSVFLPGLTFRLVVAVPAMSALIGTVFPAFSRRVQTEVDEAGAAADLTDRPPVEPVNPPSRELSEGKTVSEIVHAANDVAVEALQGMTDVLPILAEQLQSVIDHTEQAAMDLSKSFISINRKAKEQVKEVQHIFGGISGEEANRGEGSVLHDIRNNLDTLTVGLEQLLGIIKKNSESTSRILKQTQSIENIVEVSNDITENSRVLSVNATIEAARAGQHGRGFAVIAREFQQMTQHSEDATREIQEVAKKISELSRTVHNETRESEEISLRLEQETKTQGRESVDKINTMIAGTREDLEKLSAQAEEFARDISSIVMSIQFQDITRQRIEHVIEPLKDFSTDLEHIARYLESIDASDNAQHIARSKSAIERLKEKYTMEAEREVLERKLMDNKQMKGGRHVTAGSDN